MMTTSVSWNERLGMPQNQTSKRLMTFSILTVTYHTLAAEKSMSVKIRTKIALGKMQTTWRNNSVKKEITRN